MRTRRLLAVVPLLVSALLASSCSADETSASEPEPTASSGAPGDASFPVTVPHKFGESVVAEEPERVVVVGLTEQDTLLQLGVVPVAVTEWYGEKPFATWPWAEELLGDAEPEVLSTSDGFEMERIAALEPDLIIGTNAGLTAEGLRPALADRADHPERRGLDPLLLLLAGPDPPGRPRARPRGRRAGADR